MSPEEKNDSWKNGGQLVEKERQRAKEPTKKENVTTAVWKKKEKKRETYKTENNDRVILE